MGSVSLTPDLSYESWITSRCGPINIEMAQILVARAFSAAAMAIGAVRHHQNVTRQAADDHAQ